MTRYFKRLIPILIVFVLGFSLVSLQKRMDRNRSVRFIEGSPVFLPNGEVLKWISLGYRGLVADWLWIRAVLYYGRRAADEDNPYYMYALRSGELTPVPGDSPYTEQAESDTSPAIAQTDSGERAVPDTASLSGRLAHLLYQDHSRELVRAVYPLLDRITTLDPHFIFPYLFGGVYLLLDTGDVESSMALLEKGYRNNAGLWEFPFYLGWIQWMYMNDTEQTHHYLMEAVGKPECPDYVSDLLEGLSRETEQLDMTRSYLKGLMRSTDNPEVKDRLAELLQRLGREES
jgi:hypothetical protein